MEILISNVDAEKAPVLEPQLRSFFDSIYWVNLLKAAYGIEVLWLQAHIPDHDDRCIPVILQKKGPLTLAGCPLPGIGTHDQLFNLHPQVEQALVQALFLWAKNQGLRFIQVPVSHAAQAGLTAVTEPRETLVINLKPPLSEVWSGFKSEARNRVRRAVRKGVQVHWSRPNSILDRYLDFRKTLYSTQGIRPNVPDQLYRSIAENYNPDRMRVLSASYQGTLVSAIWLALDDKRMFYWDGATCPSARNLSPNQLLHWAAIRWAKKHHRVSYDLIGAGGRAGYRTDGLARFKQSLGARSHAYSMAYQYPPWIGWLLASYRRMKKVLDRPQ